MVRNFRAFNIGGLIIASTSALGVEFLAQAISIPGQTSFASRFVSAPVETEALSILNNGLQFRCSSVISDGTCWWGGAYTSLLGDENGLVVATTGGTKLQAFGSQSVANQVFDETVTSLATTPRGYGMWACEGAIGVFDTSDGSTFASYPPVPDANLAGIAKTTAITLAP